MSQKSVEISWTVDTGGKNLWMQRFLIAMGAILK